MSPQHNKTNFFANLKHDLPASLIVFLVAMPLCLGIALASGAPPFSGLIAGMIGGIIVALLSGSPLGVSGPAAGLAVIVLTAIQDLGAFNTFLLAVVIGGVIQIILGIARAGVIGYYFPASVIKGMLSGIGIIIILKQIPHAFGYDRDPEGDFEFFQSDGYNTFTELGHMIDFISPGAMIIALASLAILILWEQNFMKKIGLFKIIQGPLVAVVAGVVLNLLFKSYPNLTISTEHLVRIPIAPDLAKIIANANADTWTQLFYPSNIAAFFKAAFGGFFSNLQFPDISQIGNSQVWVTGVTIAIVASLETLLCVEATDKMDPQKRVTPTNRELVAQGTGNIISGLIGGLPITQVIVRSSANIQSGGKSKASAFFHGIMILICVATIPFILNLIPLATLAAILFLVGYKLAKPALFKEMAAKGFKQFFPFIVTILGIIFTDLLIGIGLGLAVGVLMILWNNYQTPYYFDQEDKDGNTIRIRLSENVSFLNKAGILKTLNQIPDDRNVIIDGTKNKYIHDDVLEIIEDFTENAKSRNIHVNFEGLNTIKSHNPIEQFESTVLNKPIKQGPLQKLFQQTPPETDKTLEDKDKEAEEEVGSA